MFSLSLNQRIIPLTFNETTHPKYPGAHNANNIVILRVEADLSHPAACPRAGDDFSLLPKEIDELEVWSPALGQQVLGVMGECEGDNLVTHELGTSEGTFYLASGLLLEIFP